MKREFEKEDSYKGVASLFTSPSGKHFMVIAPDGDGLEDVLNDLCQGSDYYEFTTKKFHNVKIINDE